MTLPEDLRRLLNSEAPGVRSSAVSRLVRWAEGDPDRRQLALSILEPLLDESDPRVRHRALVAWGSLSDPSSIERLQALVSQEYQRRQPDIHVINTAGQILHRWQERVEEAAQVKKEQPTRILFLAANPITTDRLRLDQEHREIDGALRKADFPACFEMVSHWALRVGDLAGYLMRHRPHIIHFAGHGAEAGGIVVEGETGMPHIIPPGALIDLFLILKDNLRCVILNACWTDTQAEGIAQVIDCVIGVAHSTGDKQAMRFAAAFYQALAYGRDVKTAFDLGRNAIALSGLDDVDLPQLRVRKGVDATTIRFCGIME